MKRVLVGAIACLALFTLQAEDCTGAPAVAQSSKGGLTIEVRSSTSNGQAGSKMIIPYKIVGTTPFDEVDVRQLVGGDNSLTVPTVPARPLGCILVPPTGNTASLTLKGSGKDAGVRVAKTLPTLIVFDSTAVPGNIIVNSSSAFTDGQVLTITWF
jgi:hypothetical protein